MKKPDGRKLVVDCPRCGRPLAWDPHNSYRPFCSERCKLIDLGQWASGNYRVPSDTDQLSADDGEA